MAMMVEVQIYNGLSANAELLDTNEVRDRNPERIVHVERNWT